VIESVVASALESNAWCDDAEAVDEGMEEGEEEEVLEKDVEHLCCKLCGATTADTVKVHGEEPMRTSRASHYARNISFSIARFHYRCFSKCQTNLGFISMQTMLHNDIGIASRVMGDRFSLLRKWRLRGSVNLTEFDLGTFARSVEALQSRTPIQTATQSKKACMSGQTTL
jgi:hypothetical protein